MTCMPKLKARETISSKIYARMSLPCPKSTAECMASDSSIKIMKYGCHNVAWGIPANVIDISWIFGSEKRANYSTLTPELSAFPPAYFADTGLRTSFKCLLLLTKIIVHQLQSLKWWIKNVASKGYLPNWGGKTLILWWQGPFIDIGMYVFDSLSRRISLQC